MLNRWNNLARSRQQPTTAGDSKGHIDQHQRLAWAALIAAAAILFAHMWQLDDIPRGLYVDETSIGINAYHISTTGRDEHGALMPLFFRAFGEFKSPAYIYTAAAVFSLVGPSELAVRLPSALFFILFWLSITALIHRIFNDRTLTLYTLIAAGTAPWIFVGSRIGLEAIAQLGLTSAGLYGIYRAYHNPPRKHWWLAPALAGIVLGASLYTYHAARLTSPLLFAAALAVYARPRTWRSTLIFSIAFLAAALPFIHFYLANPNALTVRFNMITYLFDPAKTAAAKAAIFAGNYLSHFSYEFLVSKGDNNLRHAAGFGGQLPVVVVLLALAGAVKLLAARRTTNRFMYLVLLGLLIAPAGASLTQGDVPNAQRTMALSLFIILLSVQGLAFVRDAPRQFFRQRIQYLVFAALLLQSALFLYHYFVIYPDRSIPWLETYDLRGSLIQALAWQPQRIIVSDKGHAPHTNLAFYRLLIPQAANADIAVAKPRPQVNTCIIFYPAWGEPEAPPPNLTVHNLTPVKSLTQVHCYD